MPPRPRSAAAPGWSPRPGHHHTPATTHRTARRPRRSRARSYPAPAAAAAGPAPALAHLPLAPPAAPAPPAPPPSSAPPAPDPPPGPARPATPRPRIGPPLAWPPHRPAGSCPPRPARSPSLAGTPPAGPRPDAPSRPGPRNWSARPGTHARQRRPHPLRTPPPPYHNRAQPTRYSPAESIAMHEREPRRQQVT